MNFNDYQSKARETAIYPKEHAITYPALGLNGEAGEVAEKVKKMLRDDNGILTDERKSLLSKEIGDCLWYVANLASDLNLNLADIAQENLDKLFSRKERGVIGGSGDNR